MNQSPNSEKPETFSAALIGLQHSIHKVIQLMDRTALGQLFFGGALVVAFGALFAHSCYVAGKTNDNSQAIDRATQLLEKLSAESATKQQVQDVKQQVQQVADEAPKVEIRPADAGVGKVGKPQAVVVVRPSRPLPKDAGAPGVAIPIQLPPGSVVEDAGAP